MICHTDLIARLRDAEVLRSDAARSWVEECINPCAIQHQHLQS